MFDSLKQEFVMQTTDYSTIRNGTTTDDALDFVSGALRSLTGTAFSQLEVPRKAEFNESVAYMLRAEAALASAEEGCRQLIDAGMRAALIRPAGLDESKWMELESTMLAVRRSHVPDPHIERRPITVDELATDDDKIPTAANRHILANTVATFAPMGEFFEELQAAGIIGSVAFHPNRPTVAQADYYTAKHDVGVRHDEISSSQKKEIARREGAYVVENHFVEKNLAVTTTVDVKWVRHEHLLVNAGLVSLRWAEENMAMPPRIRRLIEEIPQILRPNLHVLVGDLIVERVKYSRIREHQFRDLTVVREDVRQVRRYCPGIVFARTYCIAGWVDGEE
jgi:hypothetical protein